ncbi:integrase [Candidatus Shapirobacteria bacterium]|nr:integrase [Candidatus Shapirobacteria bacterium]
MTIAECLLNFFSKYLPQLKGASKKTAESYRHSLSLFLKFAASYQKTSVNKLQIQDLSFDMIFSFLNHLESQRKNCARTRNNRLAALKSFAKMIRMLYPQYRTIAEMISAVPQKRCQKRLIGFLTNDEILMVFNSVNLKKKDGFRDYALLHLLYDSGARAAEIAEIKLDDFDPDKKTLAILGKGNRYRIIALWPKTTTLLKRYIDDHRPQPKPLHKNILFVNQRREPMTRHGIYNICRNYLKKSLPEKLLKNINPAHSFRHSCAVNMLLSGASLTEIKNHPGHENLSSTMVYLHLNLKKKTEVQKRFIEYTRSSYIEDPKINELIDWKNKEEILNWLDTL